MANITYRQVNGYLIPNLTLPPEESTIRLGKWGLMHKDYLEKHKRLLFNSLLIQGKLYQHCVDVENQAKSIFNTLLEQMKAAEGVTEDLKEQDQFDWMKKISNIQQRAREIVCSELIYN